MQSQGLQLELSDGIGTARALINREVISELNLYQKHITINTVLVIRGQISRYSLEDGQTAFILNECPRLVLNQVSSRIGSPVPLMKAVDSNKYTDYHLRYSSFDFAIPFTFEFRQRNFLSMPAMCHEPALHGEETRQ